LKASDLFADVLERFDDHVISRVLNRLLSVGRRLANLLVLEVGTQRGDHVHVETRDVVVVVMNVLVLLVVLGLQLLDGLVLLRFNFGDLSLALGLHVFA